MSTEYTIALVGLVPCFLALAALIWALLRQQVRAKDQEMYSTLADDEPDYTLPPKRIRGGTGFVLAFTAVFVLIGWMVFQTVMASRNVARTADQAMSSASQSTEKKEQ